MKPVGLAGQGTTSLSATKTSIVAVIVIAIALTVPDQTREVYRSVLQSALLWTEEWAPKAQLAWAIASVLVAALYLGLTTTLSTQQAPNLAYLLLPNRNTVGAICYFLVLAAFAAGLSLAQTPEPSQEVREATLSALGVMYKGSPVPALELIGKRLFSYNAVLLWGSLVIGAFATFTAVLIFARSPSAKTQFWIEMLSSIIAVLILAMLLFKPVDAPQRLGPLATLVFSLLAYTIIIKRLFDLRSVGAIPSPGLILAAAIAFSLLDLNDNHVIPGPATNDEAIAGDLSSSFLKWYESRPDRENYEKSQRPYPVYLIAAQGGGIYAAVHTAAVLGTIQDRCPRFASHTFAISSVSGGSVGAAAYHAALGGQQPAPGNCFESPPDYYETIVHKTDEILSTDLLSPLLGGLLASDLLQKFLPVPVNSLDRARILEAALTQATSEVVSPSALTTPYRAHWAPTSWKPALVFNTTEVGTGLRRVYAPFALSAPDLRLVPGDYDLSVATAALVSARFPWVTPAAGLRVKRSDPSGERITKIRLVDGAYFENSGVATALNIMEHLKPILEGRTDPNMRFEFHLLVLTRGELVPQSFFGLDELIAPIVTLLATRQSRGYASINEAERLFEADPSNLQKIYLRDMDYPPPWGWSLSPITILLIQAQNYATQDCTSAHANRNTVDCALRQIANDLNLPLLRADHD